MSEVLELAAEIRENTGKSAAKIYRKKGQIPGIIYGNNKESMLVAVDSKILNMAYSKVGFKSKTMKLNISGNSQDVMVREVQTHPVTDHIEHIDFTFIEKNTPTKVQISLKFINADKSVGIKRGGKLNVILREIFVKCLAADAPKLIEVDLTQINIGQKITESNILLPKNVEIWENRNRIVLTLNGKNKDSDKENEETSPTK